MRSHKFINSLFCLVIQLVAKGSKAKENIAGIRRFFFLFLDKRYISQVILFNESCVMNFNLFFLDFGVRYGRMLYNVSNIDSPGSCTDYSNCCIHMLVLSEWHNADGYKFKNIQE